MLHIYVEADIAGDLTRDSFSALPARSIHEKPKVLVPLVVYWFVAEGLSLYLNPNDFVRNDWHHTTSATVTLTSSVGPHTKMAARIISFWWL
jgi:hypothetical protein